ncbi:MAG TPA: nucleotidyltransferase domain-containing protein [Candidatus Paceibacterota bacterium]|nr:nucleotidyltransferase domain-containing protein [Candidatus Paceibacterota bacterium]
MNGLNNEQKIVKLLFKDFFSFYNSRIISKVIGISHAGAFKLLKNMTKKELVIPVRVGQATIYSLNQENPIVLRAVEMALTIEAQEYKRWQEEFDELKNYVKFAILFGSILKNEKSAKDIDLLIVADKNNFSKIKKIVQDRNNLLNRKVHLLLQNISDFENDVRIKKKTMLEIISNGIVLFGQQEIVKNLTK